ncbi:hypothetical protein F511_29759 [Dorcoceras hygrometricum]|uniref:Uncharacterized protein n=1 Tax=Dorcoceras hygrometricum TaxID=472368 RepID=A0A2Z7CBD1_9LAMI|nr:hypothetical protein F511_29759 [Dorcoceras hygrometricum]
MVSVQYASFSSNISTESMTIGKSRVARYSIAMHISWRSNSDIGCATRSRHWPPTDLSTDLSTALSRSNSFVLVKQLPTIQTDLGMAPSAPRTRAVAAIRMKQIALDNQSRMIRRLRVQLATERQLLVHDSDFSSINCSVIPMGMAPSAPRTRAVAAIRMKQIALDNQSRMIRRLRVQLATERRGLATMKKELEDTQIALEASHKVIAGFTEIGLSMSKKIERIKTKKQKAKESHVVCHQKFQARIQEAEDSMQAQHLIIEALVEEKDSLLQTIQGLQEVNDAPAPFDDEWEEEPEEHPEEDEIEDIPMGEGVTPEPKGSRIWGD